MKTKVVVVENEKDVSEIIDYALSEIGCYEVILVNNIVDFNHIAQQNPHVVLIDDWQIDGPGLKLCDELKNNPLT